MDLVKVFSPHNFFQQVRTMLSVLSRKSGMESQKILENNLSFISPLSLDAPQGDIGKINKIGDGQWQIEVMSHGLTGSLGALPTVYTEWLIERHYRYGDKTAKAFLDIFNNRLHSLRYLAWQKYHYYAMAESGGAFPLREAARALAGMSDSTRGTQHDRYADLFSHPVRSMVNIEIWLKHMLSVPVKVTPFTGGWRKMDADLCTCLGRSNQRLADAPMLGSVRWDIQSHFTVVLGPVAMADAPLYLPKGKHYDALWERIREYVGMGLDFDIDLLIENTSNAATRLGTGQVGLNISLGQPAVAGQHKIRLPANREGSNTCQYH